jgi:hypothetical protein
MTTFLIVVGVILLGAWIVHSIAQRVELDHQRERQEFYALYPEFFKKNEPITASVSNNNTMSNEETRIKFIDEMWQRHQLKGDKLERNR